MINDIFSLFKDKEFILYFILFTVVVAIFKKPLLEVFEVLFNAYKVWKTKSDNKEVLQKLDDLAKLVRMLINGNTAMRKDFDDKLSKAVTKQQIEHIIYNQIQFLELKQNNNKEE